MKILFIATNIPTTKRKSNGVILRIACSLLHTLQVLVMFLVKSSGCLRFHVSQEVKDKELEIGRDIAKQEGKPRPTIVHASLVKEIQKPSGRTISITLNDINKSLSRLTRAKCLIIRLKINQWT